MISGRYGDFELPPPGDLVGDALRKYGEWAQHEIDIAAAFIPRGGTVVDAGSFIGTHARAFSSLVGAEGRVYAFEPNPEAYRILGMNIQRSPASNITALQVGLGRTHGRGTVATGAAESNLGASALLVSSSAAGGDVEVVPLDDAGIREDIDFMKVDVEGAELDVLLGGEAAIRRALPVIFVEVNSLQASHGLIPWSLERGYRAYGVITGAYNELNFNGASENVFGSAKECGLLLIAEARLAAHASVLEEMKLPEIRTLDDLVLLLLHKTQYPYEVLRSGVAAGRLGVHYPSPGLAQQESLARSLREQNESAQARIAELQAVAQADRALADVLKVEMQQHSERADALQEKFTDLRGLLAARDARVRELELAVAAHDEARQSSEKSFRTEIQILEERVKHLVEASAGATTALNEKERAQAESGSRAAQLEEMLREANVRLGQLDQLLIEREATLRQVLSSSSWRITGPLRRVKDRSRRPRSEHAASASDRMERPASTAVLLPIYKDVALTKACIESALPGVLEMEGARLILLNDCSPDVNMQSMLQSYAAAHPRRVQLITNTKNLGFVKTVNVGIRAAGESDLVLLNSDVILPSGWLRRLRDDAYARPFIGTVTPLSNNTTICTFPEFLQDNPLPLGCDVQQVDAAFRSSKLGLLEAPTGVGFCMYIRNECRKAVGMLNEERFGRGYGEENDFCQRAIRSGWINAITPNMFAWHKGGVSFGDEKVELIANALRTLDELHPHYAQDVQEFIQRDPLKQARLVRLLALASSIPVPKILHVSHTMGGGTEQHIRELAESLYVSGRAFSFLLTPLPEPGKVRLRLGYRETADELIVHVPSQSALLIALLKTAGVSLVHFHHVMHLDGSLLSLASHLQVPYDVTVHDYYMIGGNPTLTDAEGVFHDDDLDCTTNPLYPLPEGATLEQWRARFGPFIEGARTVIFPSVAAKQLFSRVYHPRMAIAAWHPEQRRDVDRTPLSELAAKQTLTVGVLGALSREKGADYLEQLAKVARRQKLPLRFVLIGYAYRRLDDVHLTGPYRSDELPALISREACDMLLYPALWPETYSYTLSAGLESGLPLVAPNLGAFSERLAGRKKVLLFDHLTPAEELLRQLTHFVDDLLAGVDRAAPAHTGEHARRDFYQESYLAGIASTTVPNGEATDVRRLNLVMQLLPNGTVAPQGWPHPVFRVLVRMYGLPGVRKLRDAIPQRVKSSIKLFVAARMRAVK